MFNQAKLNQLIADYIQNFQTQFDSEKGFKWEAITWFKKHWDINAENFGEMFCNATSHCKSMLDARNFFPRGMIRILAIEGDTEAVRDMFKNLYDESQDLATRIQNFINEAERLRSTYDTGKWANHFQNLNSISVYLWLMYPDKYYIYKFHECLDLHKTLDSEFKPKKGSDPETAIKAFELYDQVNAALHQHPELRAMLDQNLTDDMYPDPNLNTLTIDVIFYNHVRNKDINTNPDTVESREKDDPKKDNHEKPTSLPYTLKDFLNEVYVDSAIPKELMRTLERKQNLILQGAPGVGKTYVAKRLAYLMMGEVNNDRIAFIQFHQNYSYEDFVMGYKPNAAGGFDLVKGIFYNFCDKARKDPDHSYFLIIDEINRGNLSKIFGELFMTIEKDYRDEDIKLAYNGEPFSVPSNLYIIGTMNTADRSIAMLDYALRRRFSFKQLKPAFGQNHNFETYIDNQDNPHLRDIVNITTELNRDIAGDPNLGDGFCIGHSYFCNLDNPDDDDLRDIVKFDILPMLAEYWFDDQEKYIHWKEKFDGIIRQ